MLISTIFNLRKAREYQCSCIMLYTVFYYTQRMVWPYNSMAILDSHIFFNLLEILRSD
jgi:hypothetical protein